VMQLTNEDSCRIDESATKTLYEIHPQTSLKLLIKAPAQLNLNWFQKMPDAAYSLSISESGVYSVRNSIERQSNLLLVIDDMQSVAVCDKTNPKSN